MTTRTPRKLKQRRVELAYERQALHSRLAEVDHELASLDYALRVLDPEWSPPKKVAKPTKRGPLPRGAVAADCLRFLRQRESLWTPELVTLIRHSHKLAFTTRKQADDFASSVTMALRRYERAGALEAVEQDKKTRAIRWRLCKDGEGKLLALSKVA